MCKYIDANKLKIEIERLQCEQSYKDVMEEMGYQFAIMDILDIIDSIQQEQPSLPDNLDEAAREIVIKMHPLKDCTILGDRLTRGQLCSSRLAQSGWLSKD